MNKYIGFVLIVWLTTYQSAQAQITTYTNEQDYLIALANLGLVERQDGFENNDYWGLLETDVAPDVTSQGVTWDSLGGGLRLDHGVRDSGDWGLSPSPAGLPINGFTGVNTGLQTMYGVGGWVRSGNGADISLFINGGATPVLEAGVGTVHEFFGVIDTSGLNSFKFLTEAVDSGDPAKQIYLDNFTFGHDTEPSVAEPGTEWASLSGGIFSEGTHWAGGATPSTTTNARFSMGAASPYTVAFSQNESVPQVIVGNDNLRFDLNGNQVDLAETNITRESLIVGELVGELGVLSVENGTISAANIVVAHSNGSAGALTFQSGGVANLSGSMRVGSGGDGQLDIGSGSQVVSQKGIVGQLGGTGSVVVDGAGAVWNAGQRLDIGLGGTGDLTLSNGAALVAGFVVAGRKAGNGLTNEPVGSGTLNIMGAGTTLSFGTLSIAEDGIGSASITGGARANGRSIVLGTANSGSVLVDGAGSELTAYISGAFRGALTVGRGNALRTNNNSNVHTTVLDIANGGLVSAEETYIGSNTLSGVTNGFGVINVDGSGTIWRSTKNTFIGYRSNGTVNISNGATAEAGQTVIGRFTAANALTGEGTRGIVNVDGVGSSFSSTSSVWVGLPNESGSFFQGQIQSEGILNVRNGGSMNIVLGLQLAARRKSSGIVNIADIGTNVTAKFVSLGSTSTSTTAFDSSARLSIANGAVLDVLGYNGGGPTRYTDIFHGNINLDGGTINTAEMNIFGGSLVEITNPSVIGDDFASLTGTGTINGNVQNFGGIVAPGQSAGSLEINGELTQGAGGTLDIELGGLLQGAEYDFLDVTGVSTLDGLLRISLINGFSPAQGDYFDVLTATAINLNGLVLSGEQGFNMQVVSGGNGQVLRLSQSAIPEPSHIAFLFLGLVVSIRNRRRAKCSRPNHLALPIS